MGRAGGDARDPRAATPPHGASTAGGALGPELTQAEFGPLRDLIFRYVGVSVTPGKIALLNTRLRGPLKRAGCSTFAQYIAVLQEAPSHELVSELADAVTTNHTHFWREASHFELYERRIIPEIVAHALAAGSNTLRVWCAAASTGQEPYTLAALMMRTLADKYGAWDAGVLATDISARALTVAAVGRYPVADIAPLPLDLQRRMFEHVAEDLVEVRPELAREVTFRRLNLVSTPFQFRRPFDVVFCRNVMIYFDEEARAAVIAKLAEVIRPGGYLFVGLAEGLGATRAFDAVSPACFRRRQGERR